MIHWMGSSQGPLPRQENTRHTSIYGLSWVQTRYPGVRGIPNLTALKSLITSHPHQLFTDQRKVTLRAT
jgi:hypothetical protein